MSLSQWHTTAADNASAGTINWAEGQSPATVNDSARQTMADVRTWYEGMEWRDWGHTPVYSAATAFTISSSSSLSSIYAVNRRIRTIDSVTTSYGTIVDTTWVSSTQTVHVDNSVSLSNPMTSVAVGFDIANQPIHVSGIKNAMTATSATIAVGDILYGSATGTLSTLAQGSTAGTGFLSPGTSPAWTQTAVAAAVVVGNCTSVTGTVNAAAGVFDNGNRVYSAANLVPVAGLNEVSCLLQLSGSTAVGNSAAVAVNWASEVYDAANLHDNVTNPSRVTVPTAYIWAEAVANIEWASNATGERVVGIQKNGADIIGGGLSRMSANSVSVTTQNVKSARISVVAGDYLNVSVLQTSGGSLNIDAGATTYFFVKFSM